LQEGEPYEEPDTSDNIMHFQNLRNLKVCMDSKGLPRIFTLHESKIVQSRVDEGAARGQLDQYIQHVSGRIIAAPGAKHQDPYECSMIPDETKPWTLSREAFFAKLEEEGPDFDDFLVRAWAHQHLFESRKIAARHFVGSNFENTFRFHHVIIWFGLTFPEESELSMVHNLASHDVRKVIPQDVMNKLRWHWIKLDKFEWQSRNDEETKKLKALCFRCIAIKETTQMNSLHTFWALACSDDTFFRTLIAVADAHQDGLIKNQKLNKLAKKLQRSTVSRVGNANLPEPVNMNRTFTDVSLGTPIPQNFFVDIQWVKSPQDCRTCVSFMQNLLNKVWDLPEFTAKLMRYKAMKYVRIQLRTLVRTQHSQNILYRLMLT
jgi:hypothetical protein